MIVGVNGQGLKQGYGNTGVRMFQSFPSDSYSQHIGELIPPQRKERRSCRSYPMRQKNPLQSGKPRREEIRHMQQSNQ